jgi:hypothetical protein
MRRTRPEPPIRSGRGARSLMDGGPLHIVEAVTAPSLRRARRRRTRAGQLCWTRIRQMHRRYTTASPPRRRGASSRGTSRGTSLIPIHTMDIGMPRSYGVMSPCRPRSGRSSDSDGRSLHTARPGQPAGPRRSLGCFEGSWERAVGAGPVEPGGRQRFAADRAEPDYNSRLGFTRAGTV